MPRSPRCPRSPRDSIRRPARGTLFVFQKMVAEDMPLPAVNGPRQFSVQPGAQGAWVMNLTMSDDNPLFVDANRNGIDDAFETTKRSGALHAANAPATDRKALAAGWKTRSQVVAAQPLKIRRRVPNTFTVYPTDEVSAAKRPAP